MPVKLSSSGGGSVTLDTPSTASNYTVTLPSASGTLATTTGTGSVFTNPTINGFTGDTSAITIGTNQFVKTVAGDVGIGTSSPSTKLTVYDASTPQVTFNNGTSSFIVGNNNGGNNHILYGTGAYPIIFYTNSAEAMRIDSSGNLGLGVTPSGWRTSGDRALQIGSRLALYSDSGVTTDLGNNVFVNASSQFTYLTTAAAARYQQHLGAHSWYTATSGTAGNAISFTQAMTLDASGNLIVGDTSVTGQRIYAKSATTDGTTYATVLRNSAATLLLYVRSDGYVSTGTAAASPYNNTSGSAANLYVDAAGLLYRSTSSARYKNSITDAVHGLAEVLKLRPVTYKGNNDGDTVFGGLIAEEVHDAGLTEFVQYNDDGEPDALAYGPMVSLAFKAIQELAAKNSELESRLAALEGK